MELRGLGSDRSTIRSNIEYINLQWTRRYYECGEFSVQIRMEDYDKRIKYFYTPDRPEFGVIEKLVTTQDITGDYVQLSGRFIEGCLSRDVIASKYVINDTPRAISCDVVARFAESFPGSLIIQALDGIDDDASVEASYFGEELDDVTYPLLQTVERSQRIVYDFDNDRFIYSTWQGFDRTQSQDINNYALFSDIENNTEKISVNEDESGYKNYAVIAMPDDKFLYYDARTDSNEGLRKKFFDFTGRSPEDGQSQAKFEAACIQEVKEELQKWPKITNIEAKTMQYRFFYLEDYDLGDKCDIVNNALQKSYESRIIEVREVFKEGKHEVEIVFGDKIPTIYERMMNR